MRPILRQTVQFAALAIGEALARRPDARGRDGDFSASREAAGLIDSVRTLGCNTTGLHSEGEAAAGGRRLDRDLAETPSDSIARMEAALGLSPIEREILRIILAWSIEPHVALLIGHLNDSLQDVALRGRVLGEILGDPSGVSVALTETSSLRRWHVIEVDREGPDASVILDGRILVYAVEGTLPPARRPEGFAELEPPPDAIPDAAAILRASGIPVVALEGGPGSGRRSIAGGIAAMEQRPLLRVVPTSDADLGPLIDTVIRDARMLGARLLYWGIPSGRALRALAEAADVPLVLAGPEQIRTPSALLDRPSLRLKLEPLTLEQRRALWQEQIEDDVEGDRLARRYPLSAGQIERAAKQLTVRPAEEACQLQLAHGLDQVASARATEASWDRLVLPDRSLMALRALCAQVRNGEKVNEEWGFAEHQGTGLGLKALFHGRPGTGKSFAARVIARELGLPLYCVDVSKILSRWIGVAEQRVVELFSQARQGNAILCFDEADSLFSARTPSATTASDKFTNTLVNQLLTLVEDHTGVVLLTTNSKAALDPALMRRLHYVVEFPEPDPCARRRLWEVSFPQQAPRSEELDLAVLAEKHDLCGGAIRNVVSSAAYLAADAGSPIDLEGIALALKWEYDKLDRLAPETLV